MTADYDVNLNVLAVASNGKRVRCFLDTSNGQMIQWQCLLSYITKMYGFKIKVYSFNKPSLHIQARTRTHGV